MLEEVRVLVQCLVVAGAGVEVGRLDQFVVKEKQIQRVDNLVFRNIHRDEELYDALGVLL